jgi:HlyD family secretion protein
MRKWIIIVIIIAIIGGGLYTAQMVSAQRQAALQADLQVQTAEIGSLTATIGATGIVRSRQSAVLVWQTSGSVDQVLVQVGEEVEAGQVLAEIEQTSLPQPVILAQADLVAAQRELDNLLNSQLQTAQALKAVEDAERALEDAQDPELTTAQALKAVTDAQRLVDNAERNLLWSQTPANQSLVDQAEAEVVLARDLLDKAQDRFRPYENKPDDNVTRARLQTELSAAQQRYDAAARKLNSLQGTASESDQAAREADLIAAQAQLAQAQQEYDRIKDGPNDAEIQLLQAQLEDARREYERVKEGASPEDIKAAEARVAAAQATLNQAQLSAPFGATVTSAMVSPGDQVTPGLAAFRLDDLSEMLVDVLVSEVDINNIHQGQEAILTFDAILGKEYHGQVEQVDLVGTSNQGVVDFTVTVKLTDGDARVRSGMTAAVNVVSQQLENVLLVPNRAVRLQDGQRVVYVMRSQAPEAVEVELGASSESVSEVTGGGLKPGDQVLLNPPTVFDGGGPGFMR